MSRKFDYPFTPASIGDHYRLYTDSVVPVDVPVVDDIQIEDTNDGEKEIDAGVDHEKEGESKKRPPPSDGQETIEETIEEDIPANEDSNKKPRRGDPGLPEKSTGDETQRTDGISDKTERQQDPPKPETEQEGAERTVQLDSRPGGSGEGPLCTDHKKPADCSDGSTSTAAPVVDE